MPGHRKNKGLFSQVPHKLRGIDKCFHGDGCVDR